MYVTSSQDSERPLMLEKVLEDIPGGGTVEKDDFKTTTSVMKEGAVLGKDSNGIYHPVKTAELHEEAAVDAVAYKVKKIHEFKVGDFFMDAGKTSKAYAITAINTAEADYDTITVGTSLGKVLPVGTVMVQAAAQATALAGGSYKYSPEGIALNSVDLTLANQGCGILVRGTVIQSLLPYPVDSSIKALLPLIRFV